MFWWTVGGDRDVLKPGRKVAFAVSKQTKGFVFCTLPDLGGIEVSQTTDACVGGFRVSGPDPYCSLHTFPQFVVGTEVHCGLRPWISSPHLQATRTLTPS